MDLTDHSCHTRVVGFLWSNLVVEKLENSRLDNIGQGGRGPHRGFWFSRAENLYGNCREPTNWIINGFEMARKILFPGCIVLYMLSVSQRELERRWFWCSKIGPSAAVIPIEAKVNPQDHDVCPPPVRSKTIPAATDPSEAAANPPRDWRAMVAPRRSGFAAVMTPA